jgi:putative ATP-dependent endonuclease of OLD family
MIEVEQDQPRPRLTKLIVKNFRCIGRTPVEIELDDIVVLVGPNNVGKSYILKAYQIVMSEGSKEGELSLDDFPNSKIDEHNLPEIELNTIVYDNSPGEEWIAVLDSGEKLVREKWTWSDVGKPTRRGFNVKEGRWANDTDKEKMPWGAAGIANARRPQPHRVGAFDAPEKQAEEIIKILVSILTERVKTFKTESKEGEKSDYSILLENVKEIQKRIVTESNSEITRVQDELTGFIERIFPGYGVRFDARPEDDIDKTISLFKANPQLRMGPRDGYMSAVADQGSGARRTLLWTALRLISESSHKTKAKYDETARPHVLLLDEPEICLHPNAIRDACNVLYDLPSSGNWQVMVTTHSPCFIDMSRDNTSIVRVGIDTSGEVSGTTIFRPSKAQLAEDDKERLRLLNICDPYVTEFFFGGNTIIVEGDTEYTAFKYVIAQSPEKFKGIHIIRARGKGTIVSLVKILNHFGTSYAVLHDSDQPTHPGWPQNEKILSAVQYTVAPVRLVAAVTSFEKAFFNEQMKADKPYDALIKIKENHDFFQTVGLLLEALVDHSKPLPPNAIEWKSIEDLECAYSQSQKAEGV